MLSLYPTVDSSRQAKERCEDQSCALEPLRQFFARGAVDDLKFRVGPGLSHSGQITTNHAARKAACTVGAA